MLQFFWRGSPEFCPFSLSYGIYLAHLICSVTEGFALCHLGSSALALPHHVMHTHTAYGCIWGCEEGALAPYPKASRVLISAPGIECPGKADRL